MRKLNIAVTRHPWITIASFVIVTGVFAAALPRLSINVDVEAMLPHHHAEVLYNDWVQEYFGIENSAVFLVLADGPDGVFTPATLRLVEHLSDEMAALPDVDGDDLVSLAEVDDITGSDDALFVDPFFDEPPATAAHAREVREAVFANPMMVGTIVSVDGSATIVAGEVLQDVDKLGLYASLQRIVAQAPVGDARVLIAGRPLIEGEIGALARRDILLMFPVVVAIAGLVLWLSLGCARGVLLPLLVVVSSVVWTMGLMAWTGATFFALSNTMVIILIPIGIADGIHVIDRFLYRARRAPRRPVADLVFTTMQEMSLPVVLTSVTTAAGLASLGMSEIGSVRNLGVFTAFGVLAAMVFSLTILPAVLAVLPLPRRLRAAAAATEAPGFIAHGVWGPSARLLDFVTRRPVIAVCCGVLIAAFGALGMPAIVVDGSLVANFDAENPVRLADEAQVERFGGSYQVEIVVEGDSNDTWKEPVNLRALGRFQDDLEASGLVAETRSIVDYVMRMNAVMNPEDADAYRVPDDRELVGQYLLLYSMSGEPDDFEDVVDYDYRVANVRALSVSDHSHVLDDVYAEIDALATERLAPLALTTHGSGGARISQLFMDLIISGQIRSLALAMTLVFLLTAVLFRSIVAGLLVVLPVAIATVLDFGMLGWLDVPLGVTTALMSSIAIGIGVDYAIHFVSAYRRERSGGRDPRAAMSETLATAGASILYNAVVVVAGFLVLAMSSFVPNRVLGYLVSLSVVVCFVTTGTTLAAFVHLLQPAFVRRSTTGAGDDGVADAAAV